MKVALVHDYLKEYGGAERVLEALHNIFPEAPIYTAFYDPKGLGVHKDRIKNWNIKTSWLQNIPFSGKLLSPLRILAPVIFENFDLAEYDLVISSSNIYFSKAVITKPQTLHISYIHTPPRYLYGFATSFNYKKGWLTRVGAEIINHLLRIWDFEVSQRPDILVANSKAVEKRIKKFYRREAEVIYPPVDLKEFASVKKTSGNYFLALNRLWKSKGTEIIIEAFSKLNLALKVVGTGPELNSLKKLAGQSVEFLGEVSDEERVKLYSEAMALVVASEEEDFGINAIEAQASGTPVIAIKSGGYLETVLEGKTGEFFSVDAPLNSLMEVLKNFKLEKYKEEDLKTQAKKFSQDRFKKEILDLVERNLNNAGTSGS